MSPDKDNAGDLTQGRWLKPEPDLGLSANFKRSILETFGNDGREYLDTLPAVIDECCRRWQLENLRTPANLSYNYLAFAHSQSHGPVVLKIASDKNEFACEAAYCTHHPASATRRLLEADYSQHIMLLENIQPGHTLDHVQSKAEQYDLALSLICGNPRVIPIGAPSPAQYPTYGSWMDKSFALSPEVHPLDARLENAFERARTLYTGIRETPESGPDCLLHGDLHHENMLFDEQQGWKIIDPKGVVDKAVLECARYIRNELYRIDDEYGAACAAVLKRLAKSFATAFGCSEKDIFAAVYIDAALGNSWNLEGSFTEERYAEESEAALTELGFLNGFV